MCVCVCVQNRTTMRNMYWDDSRSFLHHTHTLTDKHAIDQIVSWQIVYSNTSMEFKFINDVRLIYRLFVFVVEVWDEWIVCLYVSGENVNVSSFKRAKIFNVFFSHNSVRDKTNEEKTCVTPEIYVVFWPLQRFIFTLNTDATLRDMFSIYLYFLASCFVVGKWMLWSD